MTQYTFNNPSTGQSVTIDAPTHDDAVRQLHDRLSPRSLGAPGHPATSAPAARDFGNTPLNFAAGVGQGLLDLPEGAAQLAEHIPYVGGAVSAVIPSGLRDWARNYRQRAESTTAGEVGEFAGNVIPAFLQPELGIARAAEAVPYIGKGLGFLGRVFERGTLPATLQPVDTTLGKPKPRNLNDLVTGGGTPTDDFWDRKKLQAEIGTGLGAAGETVASLLTRIGRSGAAQRAAQRQAESSYNAQVAAHQTGTLARAAEQQAAKDAKAAKDAIPNQTSLRWYKETLDRIGLGDQAPTEVTPAASARVQKLVGDHRNEIINRMELNQTPEFTEQINGIRDATMDELPESAQNKFYKKPPEEDLPPLLYHPTTGKPLERTTRGMREKEPKKPEGDWVKTVEEPLAKGTLKGRDLSDYISKLGARAAELAATAAKRPQDERAEMYAMADAYRRVADAVVGHAAGIGENAAADKLALEQANKAYTMWSIGNDAGRAAQGGVMTPRRLLQTSAKRMGEARLKQAFDNPKHPDNALLQHLEAQRKRMEAPLPQVRPASAVPAHPRGPRTAPTPTSGGGQAAANALTHYLLWHAAPGLGHAAYFAGRHAVPALTRRVGPALSRAAGSIGRGVRRLESPISRGAGEVVEQSQEEPSMQFKWPD